MRSLKLKVEELSVESFATGDDSARAGTVRGHESLEGIHGGGDAENPTGYVTCNGSCDTCPTGMGPACCVADA